MTLLVLMAVIALHTSQLLSGSNRTMGINHTKVGGSDGNILYGE